MPTPGWIGEYDALSRRLLRLGHIAFIGLGIPNILLARELPRLGLGPRAARTASVAMNFGNVFLPLTLVASAYYQPVKYVMSVPALSVFLAFVLAAYGARRPAAEPEDDPR
jgi:hypothetical protein